MTFQIHALSPDLATPLSGLTDTELAARRTVRAVADKKPGFPCRVSLADAEIGDTVYLMNFTHLDVHTPYAASHAIWVREGVAQARPDPGEVPDQFRTRMMSLRGFGADHMMVTADLSPGPDLEPAIAAMFDHDQVAYIHLHFAKQGCYAARITRT